MALDTLIINAKVLDGTGSPWFWADIGIKEGKILKMGKISPQESKRTIDAQGRYLSPGFVDIHCHSDLTLLINPHAESHVRQGITTEVNGNCGASLAPITEVNKEILKKDNAPLDKEVSWNWHSLGEYLDILQNHGIALNIAQLVGHGTVRSAVMGLEKRACRREELEKMKALVSSSMEEGAFGLSSGLVYPPGCYSDTEELIELAKVVAKYGGIYTSHIRGEREGIVEAIKEAIKIGEEAGLPVEISHNCPKFGALHRLKETLPLYEEARLRGLEITTDNDAHTDFSAYLWEALPQWVYEEGKEKALSLLREPEMRQKIRQEIKEEKYPGFGPSGLLRHGRWERIVIYRSLRNPALIGKRISQIAEERKKSGFDTYFDLILEEEGEVEAIFDYTSLDDIRTLLQYPLTMVCSDSYALSKEEPWAQGHTYYPCCFGEYPYILEKFVREEKSLSLEEAIRKMTSFPSRKLGLWDRGIIRPGIWADLVIFDLERIKDRATNPYPHSYPLLNFPHDYPEGIDYLLVNGEIVIEEGEQNSTLPGKVLRKEACR